MEIAFPLHPADGIGGLLSAGQGTSLAERPGVWFWGFGGLGLWGLGFWDFGFLGLGLWGLSLALWGLGFWGFGFWFLESRGEYRLMEVINVDQTSAP